MGTVKYIYIYFLFSYQTKQLHKNEKMSYQRTVLQSFIFHSTSLYIVHKNGNDVLQMKHYAKFLKFIDFRVGNRQALCTRVRSPRTMKPVPIGYNQNKTKVNKKHKINH